MTSRGSLLLRMVSPGPLTTALCIAAPVVAASLFYVWTRVTSVRLGYALSRSTAAQRRLLAEQDGLRLDVSALKSPARLSKIAAERGLTAPPAARILPSKAP